jgi:hypothetical protein
MCLARINGRKNKDDKTFFFVPRNYFGNSKWCAKKWGGRREERGRRKEEGERKERVKLKQKMKASLKQDGNIFGTTRSEIKKQKQEAFEEQQRNKL